MSLTQKLKTLTLAELAELRQRTAARKSGIPSVTPRENHETNDAPLSFAQQRLWFVTQMQGANAAYTIPLTLSLRGPLDEPALRNALDALVARHESLRTVIVSQNGTPIQHIRSADIKFPLTRLDLDETPEGDAALAELITRELGTPFDLAQGPLFRGCLIQRAPQHYVLALNMHHIVSDGWSTSVLVRELRELYAAFLHGRPPALAPLPVQYADYAAWQRRWLSTEALEDQAAYWRTHLADAPGLLELPTDRRRPATQDFSGDTVPLSIDPELTTRLKALSQRCGVTLYMTVLSAWAVLLSRLSGQQDLVIGTPTANRSRLELEGLIGFFVNTLALRIDTSGPLSVEGLLQRVRSVALDALQHQDLPFEQVVEIVRPARSLAHSPIFQMMFSWQNAELVGPSLEGVSVEPLDESIPFAKFDLTLTLGESGESLVGSLNYATALFDRSTIQRLGGYLEQILSAMAADCSQGVEALNVLPADERHKVLVEWNNTAAVYPAERCIHELFEARAAEAPDADAVLFDEQALGYRQLNQQANRLARHLRGLGVGPGVRVAICVDRSPEMIVGLLAILKAGGAYVPLDPNYPADRLGFMLADAAPQAVLTHAAARPVLDAALADLPELPPIIDLVADAATWATQDDTNLPPASIGLNSRDLAYIIYTSGSTGKPKGIRVAHSPVINLIHWVNRTYNVDRRDCLLFITSVSFDLSVYDIFGILAAGATVWLASPGMLADPQRLAEAMLDERVTFWDSAPAALQLMVPFLEQLGRQNPSLRLVFNSGDWIPLSLPGAVAAHFPQARFISLGGATEATIWSNYFEVSQVSAQWRSIPYGRPIQNSRYYILDAHLQPVPVGVTGDLYIAGTCLAEGYTDPVLTQERFIDSPTPDIAGPLYRTGDLARFFASGDIEFLGRNDFQVKIRGFRIELGEIEAQLAIFPGIREAVVLAREDVPGNKRLVAYVVAEHGAQLHTEQLQPHLAAKLPDYMVPTAYIQLDAMPVTANGKLDRKALPAPDAEAYLSRPYEPPVGEVETTLAAIWAEVLGVERVGRHDNFFELGGHSLLAVRMLATVQQRMGIEVELAKVFTDSTLAAFAVRFDQAKGVTLPPIVPVERTNTTDAPLSFTQQRLWFLSKMQGASAAYNMPMAMELRGPLNESALCKALDALVARHESLRTVVVSHDGTPVQRIAPADCGFPLVRDDMQGTPDAEAMIDVLLEFEATAPFDLSQGPLFRGRLIQRAPQHYVLALNMHHIVSDGWSTSVLVRELRELYAAFLHGRPSALAPLPVQYADYAAWQRRWLSTEALEDQAAYWRTHLADAPGLLELPTDRRRPATQDFSGDTVPLSIDPELTTRLKALSQRCGVTLYMTVLSAWAVLLSRLSGQQDLVIGTPTANRSRLELEGLIGFFVNTLALRIDTSGPLSVEGLLQRVRSVALDALQHQDLPFEQVVEIVRPARSLAHSPIFQMMFSWQNAELVGPSLEGVSVEPLDESIPFAKFDLTLTLGESGESLVGSLNYATALFDRSTIQRLGGYLEQILSAMAADCSQGVEALNVLPADERHKVLVEWNNTAAVYPAERCIHELFEARAAEAPDADAVLFDEQALGYRQLNQQANRLARHLRGLGVGPGVRVAICVDRSPEMIVGLLAILKAGGAYVPLDPNYPADRLGFMLADAAPQAVLTHAAARPVLDAALVGLPELPPIIDLVADAATWATQDDTNLPPASIGLNSRDLAYIIYTSGSTGKPKGVMIEHHSLVNRLAWMRDAYGLGPSSTALQKTPFTFDVSVWEIFGTLINGAPLVVARPEGHKDPDYLVELIRSRSISTTHFVPSMLHVFLEHASVAQCTTLKNVFCSGEALSPALAKRFTERLPGVRLHNLYGPTEATIDVTAWTCPPTFAEGDGVTIGRPIDNTRAYILDASGQPVPIGSVGELCIGGVGVARGYLNRPDLTAERFISNPFVESDRLYRTGDLSRFLSDGNIEYIGRNDFQVKLRGFRIELGDIEMQLAAYPGVRDAVVLAREDVPGNKRLVAYYVGEAAEEIAIAQLTAHLSARLPDYMVPAAYVRLEQLPVTANGKLDRKALPAPSGDAHQNRPYEAPVGELEATLAAIWADVLGVERVGRHDNFFELGGHSLLAVRVLELMQKQDIHTNVLAIFKAPVLEQLAQVIEAERGQASDAMPAAVPEGTVHITPDMVPLASLSASDIEKIAEHVPGGMSNIQDIYPLTHLQEGMLFHHLMEKDSDPYLMWSLMRFGDKQSLEAYIDALESVIERHDITRTSVAWEGLSDPVQVVWRQAPLQLEVLQFDAGQGDVAEQLVERVNPRRYRLDLRTAPLTRIFAAHDPASNQWLALRMVHHLIDDVTSAQLLSYEITMHLQGRAHMLPAPLPFKLAVMRARRDTSAQENETFFRDMLGDIDEPTAPFNLLDVHGDGTHVKEAQHRLAPALSRRVRMKAKQLGVSAASLFHVAWGQVVARTAGRNHAVFGTVLFGRMSISESAERIFGPFINTLPILVRVEGTGAAQSVRETHQRLTQLMGHEHASLALAQRCSGVSAPAPLFTSILNFRHAVDVPLVHGDAPLEGDVEEVISEERTNYPLVLNVDDLDDDFRVTVQVLPVVEPALLCAMVSTAMESLIEALDHEPECSLASLNVLPADERHKVLVEWNNTAAVYPAERCIHELFEARAAEAPDADAVLFDEQALGYRQLNQQANRLARHLRGLGVGPGVRVAICVDRSPEMIVGLLAILKAGGAYVPLDPNYPADRLGFMLADAAPQAVLTHAAARPVLDAALVGLPELPPIIDLVADAAIWATQDDTNLPPASIGLNSRDLAYIIYTSGSTGKPKGIRVAHSPVINLIHWVNRTYNVDRRDCLLFITSVSFDLSVYDIFGILAAGATVWLASPGMLADPQRLAEAMLDERVTFWDSAPAALQLMVPFLEQLGRQNPSLRLVFNSGDWIPLSLPGAVAAHFPQARFISLGGATEATIWSNYFEVSQVSAQWRSIPYGRPIQNSRYYILDAHLQPVPVGVTGDLYIAGTCLAEGYTDPVLTQERFIDSPTPDIAGPLYRTGDLARFFASGDIEFLGRNDFQVKIRGFRIELGEIEAQLAIFPGIREAVVLAREDVPGNKRLVAYVVAEHGVQLHTEQLQPHLAAKLPDYMVPTAYIQLDAMPVTANGKLDRKALPAPDAEAYLSRPYEPPVGEVETTLAAIWAEVLGVERVGRHDNFFELGGHSLLAVRMLERMRRSSLQTDIRTIFTTPVLSDIAASTQEYGEIFL